MARPLRVASLNIHEMTRSNLEKVGLKLEPDGIQVLNSENEINEKERIREWISEKVECLLSCSYSTFRCHLKPMVTLTNLRT